VVGEAVTGPRPVTIRQPLRLEAWPITADNAMEVAAWCGGTLVAGTDRPPQIFFDSSNGPERAMVGDVLIRGVAGFFPVDQLRYQEAYQEVTP
jgi:hypothetical protein